MQLHRGSQYLETHLLCIVCTDFVFYQELQCPVHALPSILNRNSQQLQIKSPTYKRPEVSAYLTHPPFSSHGLCTLDTSAILHTGITKRLQSSKIDKLLVFNGAIQCVNIFFSYATDQNSKKYGTCYCDKNSNSRSSSQIILSSSGYEHKLVLPEMSKYNPL